MMTQTAWNAPFGAEAPVAPLPPAPPARTKTPKRLLELDPDEFRVKFDREPYLVRHNLCDHPLFALPRLIELSKRLPVKYVDYNAGDLPVSIDYAKTPRNGLSIEETIRRIEENRSWMVMKRVENDPEYAKLLNECLDEIEPLSDPLAPGMYERAGAIFISSPGAVTPYHMDHEYNYLAQIRGSKQLSVFDANDRSILSEEELERYFAGPSIDRNMVFKDEYQAKAKVFELQSGFALHVPSTYPHWVKNGPAVSISFSIGFFTSVSKRRGYVYGVNHKLRQWGLRPRPFGQSPMRDSLKFGALRTIWAAGRTVGLAKGNYED